MLFACSFRMNSNTFHEMHISLDLSSRQTIIDTTKRYIV